MRRFRISSSHSGFTFVEALVSVIVLGILSAIVVPQFSSAKDEARQRDLLQTVQKVRKQIEHYKRDHAGKLPDLTVNWSPLTDGYLRSAPENHLQDGSSAVKNGIAIGTDDSFGFVYDYGTDGDGTGRFWAVERHPAGGLRLIGD